MLDLWDSLLTISGPSFLIGLLIGMTGIGGVLLVPTVSVLAGIPLREAISICMWAYVLSGLVGAAVFLHKRTIRWSGVLPVSLGACPGAFLGSAVLGYFPIDYVRVVIALLIVASGIQALCPTGPPRSPAAEIRQWHMIVLGAVTGVGSAITGTGGPVILLPLLLIIGTDARGAVGLAQAVQVPIGVFATAGNVMFSHVQFEFASLLAAILVLGVIAGALYVHRSSMRTFRLGLGLFLLCVGIGYGINSVYRFYSP